MQSSSLGFFTDCFKYILIVPTLVTSADQGENLQTIGRNRWLRKPHLDPVQVLEYPFVAEVPSYCRYILNACFETGCKLLLFVLNLFKGRNCFQAGGVTWFIILPWLLCLKSLGPCCPTD